MFTLLSDVVDFQIFILTISIFSAVKQHRLCLPKGMVFPQAISSAPYISLCCHWLLTYNFYRNLFIQLLYTTCRVYVIYKSWLRTSLGYELFACRGIPNFSKLHTIEVMLRLMDDRHYISFTMQRHNTPHHITRYSRGLFINSLASTKLNEEVKVAGYTQLIYVYTHEQCCYELSRS